MNPTLVRLTKNISSIVLVALSVLLVFGAFMPVFTVSTDEIPLSRGFTDGYFTSGISVDRFTVGSNHLLSYLSEKESYEIVFSVQNKQEAIRNYEDQIEKNRTLYYDTNNEIYLDEADRLTALRDETNAELAAYLAGITEEEYAAIDALLDDSKFVDTIALVYGVTGFLDVIEENMGTTSSYGQNIAPMVSTLLTIITMVGAILTSAILSIAIIFAALKRVIYLLKHLKNWDSMDIKHTYPNFLPPFLMVLLTFLSLMFLFGDAFHLGGGVVLAGIVWLISNLICTVNNIFAERDGKRRIVTIVKQAITLVSLLAIVLVTAGFYQLDFTGKYVKASDQPGNQYMQEYMENVDLADEPDLDNIYLAAKKAAEKKVGRNNAIILTASYVSALFLAITLFSLVERCGMRVASRKYGDPRPYGHQIPMAVLLALLLTFGLNAFIAQTPAERDEALNAGNYAILIDAHLIEGTPENIAYQLAQEVRIEALEKISTYEEKLSKVTDEYSRNELIGMLEYAKTRLANAEATIAEAESFSTQKLNQVQTFVILLVILEIVYAIARRILEKVIPAHTASKIDYAEGDRSEAPRFGDGNSESHTNHTESDFGNVNFKP